MMAGNAYDNRSPSPLRRQVRKDSYRGVTSPECVIRDGTVCAWNQNFTNATNEGNQNANNKENTNKSVRSARRMSPDAATFSIEEVLTAYIDCRNNKRGNETTIFFEFDLVKNIADIWHKVNNGTWVPSGHMCFVVESPKIREVWASTFSDRVVHHLIYNRLRPRFEPDFIATSFACIPGRGTGGASSWAEKAARKITQGWSKNAYVGQVDISNFFPSINCHQLCKLLLARVSEPCLAHLVKEIILVDVKKDAHFPGNKAKLSKIPPHKSLWTKPVGIGLPIGNLTSQFGANVYLDGIDQRIVRGGTVKHYGRYVDDIVVMDQKLENVRRAVKDISSQLSGLGLKLNATKTRIGRVADGFDFCGRFIKPYRTYLREATVKRGNIALYSLITSPHPAATVTSYFGTSRHCKTYRLRAKWAGVARQAGLNVNEFFTKAQEIVL